MKFEACGVTTDDGHRLSLVYDSDDIVSINAGTPRDVRELPDDGSGFVRREPGTAHLTLSITFKPGTGPSWVETDKEE